MLSSLKPHFPDLTARVNHRWHKGNGALSLDVPENMPADEVASILSRFIAQTRDDLDRILRRSRGAEKKTV